MCDELIHMSEKITMRTHPANERTNQCDTGFSACNRLAETKQQRQITVDPVVPFQFPGGLDTLPSGRNLDQNTVFRDSNRFVQSNELFGFRFSSFLVEGEAGVDFCRNPSRNDGQNLFSEFDELKTTNG